MKKVIIRSIRTKLIFILSLSALIAIVLLSVSMLYSTYHKLEEQAKTSLQNTVDILAQNLVVSIEFDDAVSAELLLKTLEIDADIEGAFIFGAHQELFSYFTKSDGDKIALEKKLKALYSLEGIESKILRIDKRHIIVSLPIKIEEQYLATFCIMSSTSSLNTSLKNQVILTILIAFISFILVILLALKLQGIFTKPLFKLQKAIQEITYNANFDVDLKNQYNDEFGVLFDGFGNMIEKIQEQSLKIEGQKDFVQTLLDSQEQLIVTSDGKTLLSANKTFFSFFAVDSIDEFIKVYDKRCICELFNTNAPEDYLQMNMQDETWIDYVISRSNGVTHKAMIAIGGVDFVFSVTATNLPGDERVKSAVFTNITEMENAKTEIEAAHKHTRESIEYAALIQNTLIPGKKAFKGYFSDSFTIWKPKDTVGGDIYLFEELRNENECLLMVIDCTGHGVAGAFVTMLVKAVERQIISFIKHSEEDVSPGKLLGIFNKTMKQLLKQEATDSVSNAGFDGAIIYYNKEEKIIKFAGAETPLFYIEDEELKIIKGNRYSAGYKRCAIDYEYKEHILEVKEGMQFYITTDGYLDQNGGAKSFPFGKTKFIDIITKYHQESMLNQENIFTKTLDLYQGEEETNDDITLIGLKI